MRPITDFPLRLIENDFMIFTTSAYNMRKKTDYVTHTLANHLDYSQMFKL